MKITKDTRVLVLTGAGISAESGLKTFRDAGGLWENHRVEDVATPEAFRKAPAMVWKFYKERWQQALQTKPNPGHLALAKLEDWLQDNFYLITQNVDGLHTAAGNKRVIEMHGSLNTCLCTRCSHHFPIKDINLEEDIPLCPKCKGMLRPDIVWFGEIPYHLDKIDALLHNCDVFMMIGTSGVVYPAAGFVMTASYFGAHTIAVNLNPMENGDFIDEFHQGKAGEILPQLIDGWINSAEK